MVTARASLEAAALVAKARKAASREDEATGDAPGPLVNLAPRVTHRLMRLTGDHAPLRRTSVVVHLVGKSAHDNLLRSGATARRSIVRPVPGALVEARTHNSAAVTSRIDGCIAMTPALRIRPPPTPPVRETIAFHAWPLAYTIDHLKRLLSS